MLGGREIIPLPHGRISLIRGVLRRTPWYAFCSTYLRVGVGYGLYSTRSRLRGVFDSESGDARRLTPTRRWRRQTSGPASPV